MKDSAGDMGMGALGRLIHSYPVQVIVTVVVVTALLLPTVMGISFETDLDSFIPDNDVSRADRRVGEFFGESTVTHMMIVETKEGEGGNVLDVDSMREQREISRAVRSIHNVKDVIGIVELVNIVCTAYFDAPMEKLKDDNVSFAIGMSMLFLEGGVEASVLAGANVSEIRVKDMQLLLRTLLPDDFDPDARTASMTLIAVQINGSIHVDDISHTSIKVQERLGEMDLEHLMVRHTSSAILSKEVDTVSMSAAVQMGLGIFVLVIVILFLAFRRLSYVAVPMLTLGIAVVWTFGTAMLIGIGLTALMVAVVPLMAGLGIDYSIYISWRYQEELGLDRRPRPTTAMDRTIRVLLPALSIAVTTTVISFMSNIFSDIGPIRDFGLVCALGIIYCFVLSMVFGPAFRMALDGRGAEKLRIRKKVPVFDRAMALGTNVLIRYPVGVAAVVVLVTSASLYGALQLHRHFGIEDFVPGDIPAMRTLDDIEEDFSSASFQETFVLIESTGDAGLVDPDAVATVFDITYGTMDDSNVLRVTIGGEERTIVRSLALVIEDEVERYPGLAGLYDLAPDGRPLSTASVDDMEGLMGHMLDTRGGDLSDLVNVDEDGVPRAAVIRVYVDISDDNEARELYSDMKRDVAAAKDGRETGPVRITITGGWILTVVTLDAISDSQIRSTVVAMVVSVVLLMVLFRKPLLGLVAIMPVVFSTVWVLGVMFLFDIPLNVMTITITALTIGLGIDYSVHIVERFRQEREVHGIRRSMRRTIERTGTAILVSSLTTVLGFILLIMSPVPVLRSFGLITASAIVFSFILGGFLLPLGLVVWSFYERGMLTGDKVHEVVVIDERGRPGKGKRPGRLSQPKAGRAATGSGKRRKGGRGRRGYE